MWSSTVKLHDDAAVQGAESPWMLASNRAARDAPSPLHTAAATSMTSAVFKVCCARITLTQYRHPWSSRLRQRARSLLAEAATQRQGRRQTAPRVDTECTEPQAQVAMRTAFSSIDSWRCNASFSTRIEPYTAQRTSITAYDVATLRSTATAQRHLTSVCLRRHRSKIGYSGGAARFQGRQTALQRR